MKIFGVEVVPGDWPVDPPTGAPTDIAAGFKIVEIASPEALNSMAHMLGVSAQDEWNPRTICECVAPAAHLVLMPTIEAAGGPQRHAALLRHAGCHTHGYTHPQGEPRKWLDPEGRPC